ncbi:replication-associated recombination protein A [Putridiphycobacter roseus]|uniref:Replication-associated recombination protein A n=1 Tax=Putridiphycobacter roseus TaxID=2219161 RepID=A0A2W1N0J4_9FLAO|nr:replication-associated recombination protein A [Putridiphycobacter roseus]PZE17254.1 replication-associated recombination protein A [Putridiphycobacter roseus]
MNFTPLAERMRPQSLENYIGQSHILGPDSGLKKAIISGQIPSMILWGPPGIGKTTLAQIIANTVKRPFYNLSAINSGVKEIREIIQQVKSQGLFGQQNAILFIDEIHRFSKSQQDSLLGAVEQGLLTLIGATTENPSFEVISALLSRAQVYTLQPHTKEELESLLENAIQNDVVLKQKNIQLKETNALLRISGGDARKLLNGLELVISQINTEEVLVTDEIVQSIIQNNLPKYDKNGEQHYDIISAFIKSIRGSDPNAAVYWLARMIEAGEDPKFIARRLLILAAEDIGLANPNALVMANNCFQAVGIIGYPECRIILSQCVLYLASSPKGNAAYMAINLAQDLVKKTGDLSVPIPLRNAPTKLMKDLGYGNEYKYSHDHPGNFAAQEFMPKEISGHNFYKPGSNKREQELAQTIQNLWQGKYGK